MLEFILPALGPEVASRMRATASRVLDSFSPTALATAARGRDWRAFLDAAAPSLASLVAASADAAAVARAAALGRLLKGETLAALWAPDKLGRPPLMTAVCRRRAPLVHALLSARANPDCPASDGWTSLMWASQLGKPELCAALLRGRASPNAVARDGSSPLLCAARADASPLAVVRLLLEARGNPDLVPMQSPFDEHVDMDVREELAKAKQRFHHRT